jgi:hypothetical protein
MRQSRNILAFLALASFTFAFAEEPRMDMKHHEATASESKGRHESKEMAESKETKGCGQCQGCMMGAKKMVPPKVRETGPVFTDYMS